MILNPKPKPIRFRITSGKKEHFSLESLRSCFCWREIKGLIQERRIQEWLISIDEKAIAESIDSAQNQGADGSTITAIFYGLKDTVVEWPQIVEYWVSNRNYDSFCLNLNEWAGDFSLVQQLKGKLPEDYWKKVVDYAYESIKNLPPEGNRGAWEDVAEMGSLNAKKVLLALEQKEAREEEIRKQALARIAAKESLDGLKQDWYKNTKLKKKSYIDDLKPIVGFLIDMRDLINGAKRICDVNGNQRSFFKDDSLSSLAKIIHRIDGKVTASQFGEYYRCSILGVFRFLDYYTAKKVIDGMDPKQMGPVSKYYYSKRDYSPSTANIVAKLWFSNNPFLLTISCAYCCDKKSRYFESFEGFIRSLGSSVLELQQKVYG